MRGNARMRAVVFEPRVMGGGHYFQYAANLLHALCELGLTPILLCSEAVRGDQAFDTHITQDLRKSCLIEAEVPASAALCNTRLALKQAINSLIAYLHTHDVDWLYIPTADGLLQAATIASFRRRSVFRKLAGFEILLLNGRAGYSGPWFQVFRARMSRRLALASGCTVAHFVDPYGAAGFRSQTCRVNVIPEPVEPIELRDRKLARQALGLPVDDRVVVGLLGKQDMRKGVDLFVNAFLQTESTENIRILVAGRLDELAVTQLQRLKQRLSGSGALVIHDEFMDDDMLIQAVVGSDLLVLPYRTPYQSSGILIRAAISGTPVLTTSHGFLGRLTADFGLGNVTDIYNSKQFSHDLSRALGSKQAEPGCHGSGLLGEFHTLANCKQHWTLGLRQHLHGSLIEQPLCWSTPKSMS